MKLPQNTAVNQDWNVGSHNQFPVLNICENVLKTETYVEKVKQITGKQQTKGNNY